MDLRKEFFGLNFVLDGIIFKARLIVYVFFFYRFMDTVRIAVVGVGLMGFSIVVCIFTLVLRCFVIVIVDKFIFDTTSDVVVGIFISYVYLGERDFSFFVGYYRC